MILLPLLPLAQQKQNLEIISMQYRKKGSALRGYRLLSPLIKNGENHKLKSMLRDYRVEPINDDELVKQRDDVDFLIDYYSVIEVGIIAGYFPSTLPTSLQKDISLILGNDYVRLYYEDFYPLLLPQLLLQDIESGVSASVQNNESLPQGLVLFERFLLLNESKRADEDIDMFLWFLDDGITNGYSISDLWDVLLDRQRINYKLSSSNKHPLNSALLGFIKYVQFLQEYAALLRDCDSYKLLQSSFWHYQSYWFDHMKEKLGDIIHNALKNTFDLVESTNQETLINNDQSYINSSEDYIKWRESTREYQNIERDIYYLLDKRFAEPIERLLR